jgi:hypothetical protein|tara:strand:- start:338 stop:619 length:282 start_codon:yes stop_codon:yes gene_type:complete
MAGSDITAYNAAQGAAAALIGPSRSRLQAVNIYAETAGSLTLTNGNGGATLLTQKFPVGMNEVYIPENGMLFTSGVFLSAFTGANNELTFLLA